MMKPWSIALFIAQPPMPKTTTYMQKLSTKSSEATGFNCPPAAIGRMKKKNKSWWKGKRLGRFQEPKSTMLQIKKINFLQWSTHMKECRFGVVL